jgi:hypothetical protein
MSGTFPVSPVPGAPITLRSTAPTRVSQSHSMKRNVRSRGAQRYSARLEWRNKRREDMAAIIAFVEAQRGQFGNFLMALPGYTTPLGSWAGSPVVDVAGQTGYALNLRGLTPSQTGVAKAGDLIRIGTDLKVYRVAADSNSNGTGKATVTLTQALMISPADGTVITSSNVQFTFACASDVSESPLNQGMLQDFSLDLVEDV